MARKARIKSNTGIYHVILRGVNRQQIFEEKDDYFRMLDILRHLPNKYDFNGRIVSKDNCRIFAYCLMSNHIHLLIKEMDCEIGELIKTLASKYVYYYNNNYCRIGHLFQGRFKSEAVEDREYFLNLLKYIHMNPVKSGMVLKAINYRWSSWSEYLYHNDISGIRDGICDVNGALEITGDCDFSILLDEGTSEVGRCSAPDSYLDIEEGEIAPKAIRTDSEVVKDLLLLSSCRTKAEFQRLDMKERIEVCTHLLKLGAGLRQLSRITGISLSTLSQKTHCASFNKGEHLVKQVK